MQEDISRAARLQVETERFTAKCNDVFDAGSKANPKFAESFRMVHEEVGGLMTPQGFATPLMNALLDSDVPTHKLIEHLAANPDVAAELADLSPLRQAKRIALIEHELGSGPKTPQASAAPKPLKPVTPSASNGEPDPSDTAAWIKHRNKRKG